MTETGSTVERLREGLSSAGVFSSRAMAVREADLVRVLAVVEAAQKMKVVADLQDADKTVGGSIGLAMSASTAWDQMCDALAALHSQASDDPEDRVLGPREHYDLETQKWVPGQASDEGKP